MDLANELRTMSHRVLGRLKDEIGKTGRITPVVVIQQKDGQFERAEMDKEHASMFDSDLAKRTLFEFLRDYIRKREAAGFLFACEAWMTRTTKKGGKLKSDEFLRLYKTEGAEELVKRGLAERQEVVIVTAQSPEFVLILQVPFERDERLRLVTFGPLDQQEFPQTQFAGRQKMFGDLREENLR